MSLPDSHFYQGTPVFIARAVEYGGPLLPILPTVPKIPNFPDLHAKVHPDRVKTFPSSVKKLIIDPDEVVNESQDDKWRHELEHDAESVFWLLLYWAMVVQPEEFAEERIDGGSWSDLNKNYTSRSRLIEAASLPRRMAENLTHSFYKPLRPLINDLAAIFVIDGHCLPASDPRKDPYYITEAFQRLVLNFIIENRSEKFTHHPVKKTFRKVEEAQYANGYSSTVRLSRDTIMREDVTLVGVCGSMDPCPFLLLCLQGRDDGEMDDYEMDYVEMNRFGLRRDE